MNIEDDDYCTADYGTFGSNACSCSICRPPVPKRDLKREAETRRLREKQDARDEVSRSFNRHMIDLYNARSNSNDRP